jgi:hypothetical protein
MLKGVFQPELMPQAPKKMSRSHAPTVPPRRIAALTRDPQLRRVMLTVDRWTHIVARHPELSDLQDPVVQAVHSPTIQQARPDGEAWFYIPGGPSAWLKVVVVYSGDTGRIITAFPRRAMP